MAPYFTDIMQGTFHHGIGVIENPSQVAVVPGWATFERLRLLAIRSSAPETGASVLSAKPDVFSPDELISGLIIFDLFPDRFLVTSDRVRSQECQRTDIWIQA